LAPEPAQMFLDPKMLGKGERLSSDINHIGIFRVWKISKKLKYFAMNNNITNGIADSQFT